MNLKNDDDDKTEISFVWNHRCFAEGAVNLRSRGLMVVQQIDHSIPLDYDNGDDD